jgi:hypothetical protein
MTISFQLIILLKTVIPLVAENDVIEESDSESFAGGF